MTAGALRRFGLAVLALIAAAAWLLSRWQDWRWPAALAAAAALAVLVHAGVVAAGFLWARTLARRAGEDEPGWLAALPGEVLASLRAVYLDMPWRAGWRARMPSRALGAVLLVHGYGCNRGFWRGYARWLAARGWAVDAIDLEPPGTGLDDCAAQVAAGARDLARRAGAAQVAVIGHSMGGLAARAALSAHPEAPIAHVFTLGSPHLGTAHAQFARGPCAADMLPGSAWLDALRAAESPAAAGRCTCIASRHDNIVAPLSRALLPAAESLVRHRVGHMALAFDATARAFVEQRLRALRGAASAPQGTGVIDP